MEMVIDVMGCRVLRPLLSYVTNAICHQLHNPEDRDIDVKGAETKTIEIRRDYFYCKPSSVNGSNDWSSSKAFLFDKKLYFVCDW